MAERALQEVERLAGLRPSMNISIAQDRDATLRDADAASARWAAGAPAGPFDGVPFLVKDEFDVAGLPTSLGVRCQPQPLAERDATPVARLRAAGAVFVCKTVLTEWGMSPLGNNVQFAMPHNAHDTTRAAGGSSTGSAVGVALGVAPFATGGDGGGSIRIPAALNGILRPQAHVRPRQPRGRRLQGVGRARRPARLVVGRPGDLPRTSSRARPTLPTS